MFQSSRRIQRNPDIIVTCLAGSQGERTPGECGGEAGDGAGAPPPPPSLACRNLGAGGGEVPEGGVAPLQIAGQGGQAGGQAAALRTLSCQLRRHVGQLPLHLG